MLNLGGHRAVGFICSVFILSVALYQVGFAEDSSGKSSFQFHQVKGIEANNLGRYEEAVEHFQRAMSLKPGIAETHFELAFAYDQLDKLELAIKNYETGLKINPNFVPAYIMLAKDYVALQGDLGRALWAAREAKRRDPNLREAEQIIETIEAKIKSMPGGAELLKNEDKYAKKGVGIIQSGDFTYVGPVKND